MQKANLFRQIFLLMILGLMVACTEGAKPTAEPTQVSEPIEEPTEQVSEPTEGESVTITDFSGAQQTITMPTIMEGKTNVAFVYVGPIGDGGWTYAHNQGREYLEANGDNVHTAYLEAIPEGADAERVIRALAREGFNVIFTTSFGYMDPTATVAEEFPDSYFIHVSGNKKNDTNFGNVFGAMEEAKYLAGMVAGAKAAEDGSKRVGIIAPFPIAEVIRLSNAAALGMRQTCPDCTMDIRWIFTWFDPVKEREAAESLLDAGATVIVTGADTPGPVQAAADRGLTGIAYDSNNACAGLEANCLTVPYWNWGPLYVEIVTQMQAGNWKPADYYGSMKDGLLGLYGFMEGQTPYESVPEEVIPEVQAVLTQIQAGEFDRFDIFSGPLNDNQGNEIAPAGVSLTQSDLEGLAADYMAAIGVTGREACSICMNFLVEGFDPAATIPPLNN